MEGSLKIVTTALKALSLRFHVSVRFRLIDR